MPVNITDVDTFTDPVVAPAGSDPADRTYVVTVAQGLANRTRHLKNRLDGGDTVDVIVPARALHRRAESEWSLIGDAAIRSEVNSARAFVYLRDHLPHGAVLTQVLVLVDPSNTGADTMGVLLYELVYDFATPAAPNVGATLGTATSSGTGFQSLSVSGLPETLDATTTEWVLEINASADGGTNKDEVHAVRLRYTSPPVENR